MSTKSAKVILLVVIALGMILRGSYLAEIARHPDFTRPGLDPAYYDYWARALAGGDWAAPPGLTDPEICNHPYFKPPGYPFFLALIYLVSGGSYLAPRIIQMLLGLTSAAGVYFLGRKLLGERAALIWAALMAFYWIFIYYEGELLETALIIPLFLGLFFLLLRWADLPGPGRAAVAGLVLGAAAVIRPNSLALLAAVLVWQFWVLSRRKDCRRFLNSAGALLLALLVPIAPVAIRNYLVSGEFVPLVTSGGINLYFGNHPSYTPILARAADVTGDWSCFDYPRIVRRLEREVGRPLSHSQASSLLAGRARGWIKTEPGTFLRRLGQKALLFWGPREVSNNKEVEFERLHSRVLRRIPGDFALILALALTGAILWWSEGERDGPFPSRRAALFLLLALTAAYSASFLPFISAALYRVPVIPFLLLAGAVGIDRFLGLLRRGKWKTALLAAAGFSVLLGLARTNPTGYRPRQARWYYDQAWTFAAAGRNEEAIRLYRRAIELEPDYSDAYNNLGGIYYRRGEFEEAALNYRKATEFRPELLSNYINLGLALENLDRYDEATEVYLQALDRDENYPPALNRLGRILMEKGYLAEAVSLFRDALESNPDYRPAQVNLSRALSLLGRPGPEIPVLAE